MAERLAYARKFNETGSTTQAAVGIGLAQLFWVDKGAVLSNIYLFTKNNDNITVTVSIRAVDDDDLPTGDDLVSASINLSDGVMAGGYVTYPVYKHTISLPLSIDKTTYYTIVALASSGTPNWWLTFRNLSWDTGSYPKDEGSDNYVVRYRRSTDGGASWYLAGSPSGQWNFEVYGIYAIKYPSNDFTRVSGIRHIYRPGSYRLEATLGEVSTSIELPQRDVRIPSVTPTKEVKPEKAMPLRVPERTAPELIEALREEGLLPEAGASADITALQPLPIQAGILEQFKPISQEELEKLGTVIGREAPPEPSLWQRLTPWKEEKGETFGTAFTSTFRRGFGEVAKLGEMYKRFFGGWFG